MKLHYLTPLTYPSNYANRLQVAKMSEAFSQFTDFRLFVREVRGGKNRIFEKYNTKPFGVAEVGSPKFWPQSFWLALKLTKEINMADKETVFYCRDVLLAFWLSFLSTKFRKNFFFETHSLGKFGNFFYKKIFGYARGIISTNKRKADDIIEKYGIPKEKIITFGNGIDPEEFENLRSKGELKKELGLSKKKPVILYAGTYKPEYGSGIIEKLKEKAESKFEIIVITNKPRTEALKYMKAADILLAPYSKKTNRNLYYRSPIKLKEYMATGNPIIASDLPSIREIIDSEEIHFAEPDDPESFLEKIKEILHNSNEAEGRAKKAREEVKKYTWSKRAEAIIKFIKSKN